jgi:Dr1-associated corepressor
VTNDYLRVTFVAKALELFMISIVTKAATEAKLKSSKRVTSQHLKQAVVKDEQFDFLINIVSKVPDGPAPAKRDRSDDEGEETKKKKSTSRRKRKDSEEL